MAKNSTIEMKKETKSPVNSLQIFIDFNFIFF